MKAIQKFKDAVMSVISTAKAKWSMLSTSGKVIIAGSVIFGGLISLKIAGVLTIGWGWIYALPLFIIATMVVAAFLFFVVMAYYLFRDLFRYER